jgi:hypothetical protein
VQAILPILLGQLQHHQVQAVLTPVAVAVADGTQAAVLAE